MNGRTGIAASRRLPRGGLEVPRRCPSCPVLARIQVFLDGSQPPSTIDSTLNDGNRRNCSMRSTSLCSRATSTPIGK